MSQSKIRVAVLYGGRSGEHEVSIVSANNVIQNLDRELFEVIPIGIDKEGAWFIGDDILKKELNSPAQQMLRLQCEAERLLFNPDLIGKKFQPNEIMLQSKQSDRIFDAIFPVIHGTFCEDGTMQGLLELADVPYVGCGVLASAVGMDKDVSKRLVMQAGLSVGPFRAIKRNQWSLYAETFCQCVNEELTYPVFVKPANTGSSVGVQKVKSPAGLAQAIEEAFQYDVKVVVEQGIHGKEIEIAVLESKDDVEPLVSVPGEIKPTALHEFYSYASKYLDENGAELFIPADVSPSLQKELCAVAKQIFSVLDCEGMARVDLFLEKETDRIYFNEINTIPGFTQISMYPKLMAASGVGYTELLTRLVYLAMDRHSRKKQLKREFVTS